MKELLIKCLVWLVIRIVNAYICFRKLFFYCFGPLINIYYLDKDGLTNITFNYYFNYHINPYQRGRYFYQLFDADGTSYVLFKGSLVDINKIKFNNKTRLKRKTVILMNNKEVVNFDLNRLDNYYRNILSLRKINPELYDDQSLQLSLVLRCFDVVCDQIKIISLFPQLCQITQSIDKIRIEDIYIMVKEE